MLEKEKNATQCVKARDTLIFQGHRFFFFFSPADFLYIVSTSGFLDLVMNDRMDETKKYDYEFRISKLLYEGYSSHQLLPLSKRSRVRNAPRSKTVDRCWWTKTFLSACASRQWLCNWLALSFFSFIVRPFIVFINRVSFISLFNKVLTVAINACYTISPSSQLHSTTTPRLSNHLLTFI